MRCKKCKAVVLTRAYDRGENKINEVLCWDCITSLVNENHDILNAESTIDKDRINTIAKKVLRKNKISKPPILNEVLKRLPDEFIVKELVDVLIAVRIENGETELGFLSKSRKRSITDGFLSRNVQRGYFKKVPDKIATYKKLRKTVKTIQTSWYKKNRKK